MRRLSPLALPGYAVCLWLLIFPAVDVLAVALPLSPTMPEWRYSLVEVTSRSLMTPMLGMFGILILASVFEHEGALRGLRILAWAAAVMFVMAMGSFVVDSMGLRGEVRRGMAPVFGGPWFAALAKLLLSIFILVMIARGAGAQPEDRGSSRKGTDDAPSPASVKPAKVIQ